MSALPPITDVGRRIQVGIWLSVYEYTPYHYPGPFYRGSGGT